ncbi:MAG TPA: GPW/gp25 family protein [Polyangiaceae bacterium]|nr:GPW/gp25 family protein [Polyangiaceae bacterium]
MAFYEKLSGKPSTAVASIARNLQAVLNAKEGYAASVEVFGIGRYDGHYGHRELLDALIGEMLTKIRALEPRLKEPALILVGKDRLLWVRFELTGRCNEQPCRFQVLFHSIFRHVRVTAV